MKNNFNFVYVLWFIIGLIMGGLCMLQKPTDKIVETRIIGGQSLVATPDGNIYAGVNLISNKHHLANLLYQYLNSQCNCKKGK